MLSDIDIVAWKKQMELSDRAKDVIDLIRNSGPARRVGGGRSNVSGRYPSKKMGTTIQFESHRVELAAVYELEHDSDVLEYFDQPPSFKLEYASAAGRNMGVFHTADYFAVRKTSAGWEECKTQEELVQLSSKNPNRYTCSANGRWICPPGEAYAKALGLYYRVRSSRDIDWVFQRNIQFLEDYLRSGFPPDQHRQSVVFAIVAASPAITLAELFEATTGMVSRDDIYGMLACGEVYVDLRAAAIMEPLKVLVFTSKNASMSSPIGRDAAAVLRSLPTAVTVGDSLQWDGRVWKILNAGATSISLLGEAGVVSHVPLDVFEAAVKGNRIIASAPDHSEQKLKISKRLASAGEDELRTANGRLPHVARFLGGEQSSVDDCVPGRTLRRWVAAYSRAEKELGSGYLGLLPQPPRGNARAKLPDEVRALMNEFIATDYETVRQKSRYASWIALKMACGRRAIPSPSFKTFCRAVELRSGAEQTTKRQGRRAAYAQEDFYWELALTTPRHGDRPFEIVHIDHTELDVETVFSRTGRALGRPWLTFLMDAYSRRILAVYLTFDAPSYRSCMMVLRECVRRHARLPQIVVVDGGREFQSVYFETLLARYQCTKKNRPAAKPRFGSVCERLFGTTNTQFVHNLKGNTQITRLVRQVTESVNPKGQAVWPLEDLHRRLAEYAYGVYDTSYHSGLAQSPREAYETGIATTGQRAHKLIAYDREFLVHTLPTTAKGTANLTFAVRTKIEAKGGA